jgi:hypothetical protein
MSRKKDKPMKEKDPDWNENPQKATFDAFLKSALTTKVKKNTPKKKKK